MALSAEWEEFIAQYGVDGVYWYVPKGATADTDDARRKFKIFDRFEGEVWTPTVQRKIAAALRQNRLSVGGNALPRQIKRVYENLGLCWIADNQPIRITSAGKSYLKEGDGRSQILDRQVWRYQLPTPVNSSSTTAGIALYPHAYFVGALLQSDGYITGEEFVLFVARARKERDLPNTIKRISAWRNLSSALKSEIKRRLHKTYFGTINRNHSYALAFHHCDLLLHRGKGGLYTNTLEIDPLSRRLEKHQNASTITKYRSEPDYIASIADLDRSGTIVDALDYYVDVSDVENAVRVFKELPESIRGGKSVEEFEEEQFLEKHLETWLQHHLDQVEIGLKLVGRQHPTKVGPIDLLAQAQNGDLVVLELKKGRAADKVFGQICRYMGCIIAEQPQESTSKVRGYIVGREIDEKLRYAAKVLERDRIGLQVFTLMNEKDKKAWIQIAAG